MTVKMFECSHCGKMMAHVSGCCHCPTMCCGEPMKEVIPNSRGGALEKHVPVYEVKDNVVSVKVATIAHPMNEEHFIEWVLLATNKGNQRKVLNPGDAPEVKFAILPDEEVVAVYAYCNLHGLYQA